MRILIFDIAKPKEAAALFAYDLALGLKQNNVDVYAYLPEEVQNKECWDSLLDRTHIYYTKLNNGYESHAKQLMYLHFKEKNKVSQHFFNITFDYVLTTVFANWSTFIRPIFKTRHTLTVCHDPIPHSDEGKLNSFLAKRYYKKSEKLVVLSRKFIPIACKRFKKDKENVIYMPHGRTNNYSILRKQIDIIHYDPNKINFLFFGRINRYKGLHVLADAYRIISSRFSNVSLTIAGNGDFSEFEGEYNSLPNIHLIIRYIKDEEISGLFNGVNVVTVIPYIDASQSGIISVAMEYGTPIIASDTGGLKEQLDNGNIGFLFKNGNSMDLANKMKLFIDNGDLFAQQKEIEKKYIRSLNWDVVTRKIVERL